MLFYHQFTPQNVGNHFQGFEISKFSGEACPQTPLEKRNNSPLLIQLVTLFSPTGNTVFIKTHGYCLRIFIMMGSEEISLSSLGRSFQILHLNLKDLWQEADLKWKQRQAGDYYVSDNHFLCTFCKTNCTSQGVRPLMHLFVRISLM